LIDNNIGDEGIEKFAFEVQRSNVLNVKYIDLSSNFITDKSGLKLSEALITVNIPCIKTLILIDNNLSGAI
jgi:Ran GTPase-activating protein (RanGAP) involved in mRNA processing and transport